MRFSWIFAVVGVAVFTGSVRPAGAHQVELTATCAIPDSPATLFVPVTAHTVDCTMDGGSDVDLFAFAASSGERVRVMLASEADHLDPRLVVFSVPAPFPVVLADLDCDGGSVALPAPRCAVTFDFVAPASGTYNVEVRELGADESGDYVLEVEVLPGAVDDVIARPLDKLFEQLIVATDIDHYKVNADVGEVVEIELEGCDDWLDPRVEVWGPDGATLVDASCTTPPGPPPPLTGATDCSNEVPGSLSLCTVVADFDVTVSGLQRISISDAGANNRGRYQYTVRTMPEPAAGALVASALAVLAALAALASRR